MDFYKDVTIVMFRHLDLRKVKLKHTFPPKLRGIFPEPSKLLNSNIITGKQ